jgi:GNAT superfamily N-acetyltransferase
MDLVARSFAGRPYREQIAIMRGGRLARSSYDWETSRAGLLNGRMVAHFGVYNFLMRLGRARLRVAGVGLVATDPGYRRRGLMMRTARAALEAVREAGYDLSFLSGIPGFYGRLGYVRCWVNHTCTASAAELLARGRRPRGVRSFNAHHRDELARLYNRENSGLAGTMVRPTYPRCKMPRHYRGALWRNARGAARGYLIHQGGDECLRVVDWAGPPKEIMAVAGRLAESAKLAQVHFAFPHRRGRLARELRRGNCRVVASYERDRGPMAKLLNLTAVLQKLSGDLTERLARSPLRGWRGVLSLSSDSQPASLRIRRGRVGVIRAAAESPHAIHGGAELVQLLLGTDVPEETVAAAGMRLSGDAAKLLPVLFPPLEPQATAADQP